MYVEECRPLKRSKLGVPDVYPQEVRQREVRNTTIKVYCEN